MKIFDGHADIFYDVTRRALEGEKNILRNYHKDKLKKGGISGGVFISWIPERDYNKKPIENPESYFQFMMEQVEREIESSKDFVKIIKDRVGMEKLFQDDEFIYVVKGMEGIKIVDESLQLINQLYALDYRLISLTWNEDNLLASGCRGDEKRGVTELGRKALKKMEELGIVIDVSHLNEKSFWDVISNTQSPIIASHSNAYSLCRQKRNLTDEQIKAIGDRGGVIGLNAYRGFVSENEEEKDIEHLVDHLDYMVSLIGTAHVALGFDFCEYLYSDDDKMNPEGLKDASEAYKILDILEKRGYSKEEIRAIAYGNLKRVFMEVLK
ncbi:MAG: dipeptidase [Fusobacteriaceae bacterium]